MRIPVRMLGVIASLFSLFLFLTAGVIIYSAAESIANGNITAKLGPPSGFEIVNGTVRIKFPLTIINRSPYDFTGISFQVNLRNATGNKLVESSARIEEVRRYTNSTTNLNLQFNYTSLLFGMIQPSEILFNDTTLISSMIKPSGILFNDTTLRTNFDLGLTYASLFGIGLNVSSQMNWGAPLSRLSIEKPYVVTLPSKYYVNIPIKFSNHSPFEIDGELRLDLLDANCAPLGSNDFDLTIRSGEDFNKTLQIEIPSTYSGAITVKLTFSTGAFTYRLEEVFMIA